MGSRLILILCEGTSEENAIQYFIERNWNITGVGLKTIQSCPGKIVLDAKRALELNYASSVFSLFDLYGFYPYLRYKPEYKKKISSLSKKESIDFTVLYYKEYLLDQIGEYSKYFFPHFAVHEIEAWILAEGTALKNRLKMKNYTGEQNAEEINFDNPPKKRLNDIFCRQIKTGYLENTDSRKLFTNMDITKVTERCPYFRQFYDELVKVGNEIKNIG